MITIHLYKLVVIQYLEDNFFTNHVTINVY